MVLCCRDHLNGNDSPKGRSDPALSLERLSHSPSPPSSVHVEAEETQELLILPPHLFPAHPHISVVASWPVPQAGTSWTLLFSVSLTHPAHQEALRTQWPKRKKNSLPLPSILDVSYRPGVQAVLFQNTGHCNTLQTGLEGGPLLPATGATPSHCPGWLAALSASSLLP